MSSIGQITAYPRFAFGLRRYLQERATAELGRDVIVRRLRDRDANFLALMKRAVFYNPASPYAPLLLMAGCEYSDFESSVLRHGIEATLQKLQSGRIDIGFTWTSVPNAQFAALALGVKLLPINDSRLVGMFEQAVKAGYERSDILFAAHAESRLQFSAEGISAALVTAQRNCESFHPGALEFYRDMGWVD